MKIYQSIFLPKKFRNVNKSINKKGKRSDSNTNYFNSSIPDRLGEMESIHKSDYILASGKEKH